MSDLTTQKSIRFGFWNNIIITPDLQGLMKWETKGKNNLQLTKNTELNIRINLAPAVPNDLALEEQKSCFSNYDRLTFYRVYSSPLTHTFYQVIVWFYPFMEFHIFSSQLTDLCSGQIKKHACKKSSSCLPITFSLG